MSYHGRNLRALFFAQKKVESKMTKVDAAVKPPKVLPKPRTTEKQWIEAETLFINGEMGLAAISRHLDVTHQSVYNHMKRRGITKGSRSAARTAEIIKAVEAVAITDVSIMAARIKETKEDHYKMASGLAKLTWAEVLKTKQDGVPVSAAMPNLRALDAAMGVLKKAREERWSILGLDKDTYVDEDSLPELVISELTADQVQALQSRSNDFGVDEIGDDDLEVVAEDA